ncbi:MAG TPA: hypothetical protein VFC67_26670 [Prolixibacteraceae bacterium]|nr:hypothetical protein [Prolixibacteraceae bacterium]
MKKRLIEFLAYLRIGQDKFEKSVGLSRAFVNKLGDNTTLKTIDKISSVYPELNISWLKTGEGSMLKSNKENQVLETEEDFKKAIDSGLKLLPEVNFEFAAGKVEIFNDSEFIKRYWYLPECKDCDGVAQIAGNSMSPSYPSGCWVALKKYGYDPNRPNEIAFGNTFGVVIENPVTGKYHGHVKILRRHKDAQAAKKYWIARSINITDFDDFDIDISTVRGLWIVKQHVVSDILL